MGEADRLNVGLCVYNTQKFTNVFLPHFNLLYWGMDRRDSRFIPITIKAFPHLKEVLDVKLLDKTVVSSERFYSAKQWGNTFSPTLTSHYHAWKGEMEGDNWKKFSEYYHQVLSRLQMQASQDDKCATKTPHSSQSIKPA
jgi:hypothetical protein